LGENILIKDIIVFIPLISFFIIIIYYLFSFSLRDILSTTESIINNSSKKSVSILVLFTYVLCFSIVYFLLLILEIKNVSVIVFYIIEAIGTIPTFFGFFYMYKLFTEKGYKILLKEYIYKPSSKQYKEYLHYSMYLIVIFSIIHSTSFTLQIVDEDLIVGQIFKNVYLLMFFLKVCILFVTAGYLHSYGVLHNLSKFNFILSNDSVEAFLIGVNKEFYIIKEDKKKAISIKKELVEKMEFL
jgi:hypothetical protein